MTSSGQPERIVIIGAGGFGREVLDVIEAMQSVGGNVELLAFVDDGKPDLGLLQRRSASVIDWTGVAAHPSATFVVGIGDPRVRRPMARRVESLGNAATKVVHPSASFGFDVRLGEGQVICAHVSMTTNITLGKHVHVNVNSTIGHDCTIGDYVTISHGARISGDVQLGDGVTVGAGAILIQGITVGAGTTVGAGAVVTRDLPANVVAMGAPAKPTRSLDAWN